MGDMLFLAPAEPAVGPKAHPPRLDHLGRVKVLTHWERIGIISKPIEVNESGHSSRNDHAATKQKLFFRSCPKFFTGEKVDPGSLTNQND